MGSKTKMSRGKRGSTSMSKLMHHSPGGKMKGFKADKHPKKLNLKSQDPKI
jgi:hypothetical protein